MSTVPSICSDLSPLSRTRGAAVRRADPGSLPAPRPPGREGATGGAPRYGGGDSWRGCGGVLTGEGKESGMDGLLGCVRRWGLPDWLSLQVGVGQVWFARV